MKCIYVFCFLLLFLNSFSQARGPSKLSKANFIATVDTMKLTKDGIWLLDYVVNISHEKAKELQGKKIKVTGKVIMVKGLKNLPKTYDRDGNEEVRQGREGDTKYIENPKIEVVIE